MEIDVSDEVKMSFPSSKNAGIIQTAIDSCSAEGGGRVVLNSPGRYLIDGINGKSNVDFFLGNGVILLGSGNESSYTHRPGPFEFNDVYTPICALVFANGCENFTLSGSGVIDGNYKLFIPQEQNDPSHLEFFKYPRPMMCYFENCKSSRIDGITFRDSAFWTIHLVGCKETKISDIKILNDMAMPNTDGIDIDRSVDTEIVNCFISGGDDGVCLKCTEETKKYGDCDNVYVNNCEIHSTSAAIKFGSSSFGDFRNCLFENITINDSNRAIGLQLRDGGSAENITFNHISLKTIDAGPRWWGAGEAIYVTLLPRDEASDISAAQVRNLSFSDISGEVGNGIILYADDPKALCNISLDNVHLTINHSLSEPLVFDMRPCDNKRKDFPVMIDQYLNKGYWSNGSNLDINDVNVIVRND